MNQFRLTLQRRALLGGLLGFTCDGLTRLDTAQAQTRVPSLPFADGATFTVAGPDNGYLDTWGQLLRRHLSEFLPTGMPLDFRTAGSPDGITGANQFEAQAHPDGSSLLLVPGAAALGWLLGEPRVQFDIGKWVPLISGFCPLALAGKVPASDLRPGQRLRIGLSTPNGPELSALLGLAQIGLQPEPVVGVLNTSMALSAYAQGSVDLIVLRGPDIVPGLAKSGATPICVLGSPGEGGILTRSPYLPDWPHLGELLNGLPDTPLVKGWRATALAAQLAFALVLPQLTPAAIVALWRHAAGQITPEILKDSQTTAELMQLEADPTTLGRLISTPEARTEFRAWASNLATHVHARPG